MYKIGRLQIYLLIAASFFIQSMIVNYMRLGPFRPDMPLLVTIFFAFFIGPWAGLECGMVCGLAEDLFAFDYLGINALIFAVTGLVVGAINNKFSKESRIGKLIIVFSFTSFAMISHYLIESYLSSYLALNLADYIASSVLPAALCMSAITLPVFLGLCRLLGFSEVEEYL